MNKGRNFLLFLTVILMVFVNAGFAVAEAGYEEGTSDSDDIVITTPAEKVLLVVSFGTSFNQSRDLTIGGIEKALSEAYPDYQIRRAFTSGIIIDKLYEREKLYIDSVGQALNRMVLDKVKEVVIQPTTIMSGLEYNEIIDEAMAFSDKFESFKVGKPLLSEDVDYDKVAELIVNETSAFRAEDTAIAYMGHGTEHEANDAYAKLQQVLLDKGYTDYVIGTVEAEPDLDSVRETLKEMGVTKVVLRPLMIVAGDHANNDMAGDEEDSWKTVLTADGYDVETVVEGLGQIAGIQDIFVRHAKEAMESSELSETPVEPTGITANRIKNGVYPITVNSSTAMFKIVDCRLTVEDNAMWAVMTLSGQGFRKVYMGTGEEALADSEENHIYFTDAGERHAFTVPVEALDKGFECSGFSDRKETWYDHIVVFESADMPKDAFLPVPIDVSMTGGSGKASVQSPAILTYKDGTDIAEVVWSSPNYAYMIVNGKEYLPVNTEGNSTFEIPVALDADMNVIACTTAMSTPKEIEYVLHFDSSTIQ